ncbi:hypothetical protein A3D88_01295 [Candidatus Peribacteria bacterium RIFCSPHIGHO2_02_FULL_52_16]|nr:MAG: hypothetical protein A2706_03535 [Candidatus Peribacteria bacterium RIFCSPHIGHO2_01_FULL_51_35]OGJ60957.1 MAG: hypothetical protein A3D88_01295 [Candidatus Peribacteria bacterium RIFCSPHIGHO2_02_FULL_52_16]
MPTLFKKKSPHVGVCLALHVVLAILLFVASVAAVIGAYKAHVLSSGLVFGTTSGSMSLLALAVASHFWMKHMKCCVTKCEACNVK